MLHLDLIVMPTHGYRRFEKLLLGSVTAKVLHKSKCPIWTGAHVKEVSDEQALIRNVLCAIDFSPTAERRCGGRKMWQLLLSRS